IGACVYEQPAAPRIFLSEWMINVDGGAGHNVFVVQIRGNADDPTRLSAYVNELHYRIGPKEMVVDCILIGEHALGQALADDHNQLAALAVGVIKVASGQKRDSQRRKEAR